jgi:replicative DNA helicase
MNVDQTDARTVIACALRYPEFLEEACDRLGPEHFVDPALGSLWIVVLRLAQESPQGISVQSLISYLDGLPQPEEQKRGNVAFVLGVVNAVPPLDKAARGQALANLVAARRAVLLSESVNAAAQALASGDIEAAERALVTAGDRATSAPGAHRTHVTSREEADQALAAYERIEREGAPPSTPFGFACLDTVTDGIVPGRFVVLAAAPGECKSTFAYHLCDSAVSYRRRVLFVSCEVSAEEVLISTRAVFAARRNRRFPTNGVARGTLTPEERENYYAAVKEFDPEGFLTVISGEFSIADVERRLVYAASSERPYDVVIVDYNQLLRAPPSPDRRYANQREELAAVLRAEKQIAMRRHVGLVGLHQINREGRERAETTGMYRLSDLSESAEVERNADLVLWSLIRDDERRRNEVRLGMMKSRRGKIMDPVVLQADLEHGHIADVRQGLAASFERFIK